MAVAYKARILLTCLSLKFYLSYGIQVTVVNKCNYSVWPGVVGNGGFFTPKNGGFHLPAFRESVFEVADRWSGRVWARKGCCFNKQGKGSCKTGDCDGQLNCRGLTGKPPATVVEMTFGTVNTADHYYDVSLVDGFNIPVTMAPIAGGSECGVAGCEVDLNKCCPSKLAMMQKDKVAACKSACLALNTDKYCCTGKYNSIKNCKPSEFAHHFKSRCPHAFSFPYDHSTSLKSCKASRYLVTFCPPAK